jgi:hypothetical protein
MSCPLRRFDGCAPPPRVPDTEATRQLESDLQKMVALREQQNAAYFPTVGTAAAAAPQVLTGPTAIQRPTQGHPPRSG